MLSAKLRQACFLITSLDRVKLRMIYRTFEDGFDIPGLSEYDYLGMITRGHGNSVKRNDLTGEVAESEGMVCGGTMEILLEVMRERKLL